jgi:hypothetical protein
MTEETKKQNGNNKEENKHDILDQIKKAEIVVKQALLVKMLGMVKQMSHDVLELKEKCTAILTEVGLSSEDVKRVIDFVNNLSSVQLNDSDREIIRKWAKDEVQGKRKDIEKKIEDKIKPFDYFVTSQNLGVVTTDGGIYSSGSGVNHLKYGNQTICHDVVLCSSSDGKKLEVNL